MPKYKLMTYLENLLTSLQSRLRKLPGETKRKIVIICTAAGTVILVLSVVISLVQRPETNAAGRQPERAPIRLPIPPGEIFLPDEPDFLPGVLLERERRSAWTEDDASEFWQNPLRAGEEGWRGMIETAIDELLERVP